MSTTRPPGALALQTYRLTKRFGSVTAPIVTCWPPVPFAENADATPDIVNGMAAGVVPAGPPETETA